RRRPEPAMPHSKPEQLRFHAVDGLTVHADFNGGALSSDFGMLLLRETEGHCGLLDRLAGAIKDKRHACYIDHSIETLLTQRVLQVACGHEDANDGNTLRHDPLFKLGAGRPPLDDAQALARAATFTRLEQSVSRAGLAGRPPDFRMA